MQHIQLDDDVKRQATMNLVWKVIEGTFGNAEPQLKRKLAQKMGDWTEKRLMGLRQIVYIEGDPEKARKLITTWL